MAGSVSVLNGMDVTSILGVRNSGATADSDFHSFGMRKTANAAAPTAANAAIFLIV